MELIDDIANDYAEQARRSLLKADVCLIDQCLTIEKLLPFFRAAIQAYEHRRKTETRIETWGPLQGQAGSEMGSAANQTFPDCSKLR